MQFWDDFTALLLVFIPTLIVLVISIGLLAMSHWYLISTRPELGNEGKFSRQLILLFLTIICILAVVIVLPIEASFRNQIIGLIGILLSGMIAFSSTSIIANLMAGVLLRITKPFRTGDFVKVGEFFGRVSERGLFETEIQNESRELIAIPNTYLVNNPVSTVRSSGAIVSASLSLGYDVHHSEVETILIKAAGESGLEDPFVNILELGNYSITYRVSGVLNEVKGLITARSNLFRAILDELHGQDIEIMSPTFMSQRRVAEDEKMIPTSSKVKTNKVTVVAEEIIFDKAEQAAQTEGAKQELSDDIKDLEIQLKDASGDEKVQVKEQVKNKRSDLKSIEQAEVLTNIETNTSQLDTPIDLNKPHN
ncbi:mechanosensitive ion channel [Paraglaciecola aquimarina]|uniref:Small-conductance mechanosensitive channel n=1 Tax=Paraglaciecola algarum TaxID=3050085 RepID=A0ABS9D241_9ALTE|nr:mechanosensitive ion channel domain-containing protein [Paraglaciecola sp. G1-23]MCF2946810.1 mechanosensitive ion channel [Paraglaciecola sp. G1-23]